MSHGVTKCKECGSMIRQCRCRNHTQVTYEVCKSCEDKMNDTAEAKQKKEENNG